MGIGGVIGGGIARACFIEPVKSLVGEQPCGNAVYKLGAGTHIPPGLVSCVGDGIKEFEADPAFGMVSSVLKPNTPKAKTGFVEEKPTPAFQGQGKKYSFLWQVAGSWFFSAVLLLLLCWPAKAQGVWDLLPYRVELWVAVPSGEPWAQPVLNECLQHLQEDVDRWIGPVWNYELRLVEPKIAARLVRGEPWSREVWPEHWTQVEHPDKAIVVTLTRDDLGFFHLSAQELDLRSQSWGPKIVRQIGGSHLLAEGLFEAVCEAFCPIARLVSLDLEAKTAQLRVRGGGLELPTASLRLNFPGQVYRIFVRYNDRLGRATRIQDIPFSYLLAEKTEGAVISAKLISAFRSPLSARRRGRVEQLLVATRAYLPATRLVCRDRAEPDRPLRAYWVYRQSVEGKETTLVGTTDDNGSILVPNTGEGLIVLWVKNGQVPLARLPVVPGAEEEVVAHLPRDDERLEAEAFVLGLQEELLDLVTRRQILLTRAEWYLRAGQRDRARQMLEELRSLQTLDDFRRYLLLNRKRLIASDPLAQKRIDQMFSKTEELLRAYLDPQPIETLAAKLRGP